MDQVATNSLDGLIALSTVNAKRQQALIVLNWFENELENIKNEIKELQQETERKTAK